MLSVVFNSGEKFQMEKKTKIRGNREIFNTQLNSSIEPSGNILIYENDKEVDNIIYTIYDNIDLSNKEPRVKKWHQLNLPSNTYVLQVNSIYNDDTNMFLITKIAIQKLIGKQNILLNI
jgi:hypothetical protein